MAAFYFDTDKKLVEIFTEHCNLSREQYDWIRGEFIYLVADIQDEELQEEVEQRMEKMGGVFDFLLATDCLTTKEHFNLSNLLFEVWESHLKEFKRAAAESGVALE